MVTKWQNFKQVCKKLIQLSFAFSIASSLHAADADAGSSFMLNQLNPYQKSVIRAPGSFIPTDEFVQAPEEQKIWLQSILVEDDAGVLRSIRDNFREWEEKEEYAKNWNIESIKTYETPSQAYKKSYLSKKLLKYADKRLSGEIKKADEGSTLHRVGQLEKALRPKVEAQVSKRIKIKVKARVLQAKAIVRVDNPWVEHNTELNAKGHIQMNFKRDFSQLGANANVRYQVNEGQYVAWFDKQLVENWIGRVSSEQSDKDVAFSGDADKKLQLLFNKSF